MVYLVVLLLGLWCHQDLLILLWVCGVSCGFVIGVVVSSKPVDIIVCVWCILRFLLGLGYHQSLWILLWVCGVSCGFVLGLGCHQDLLILLWFCYWGWCVIMTCLYYCGCILWFCYWIWGVIKAYGYDCGCVVYLMVLLLEFELCRTSSYCCECDIYLSVYISKCVYICWCDIGLGLGYIFN